MKRDEIKQEILDLKEKLVEFEEEEKRWNDVKIGDIVYEQDMWNDFFDFKVEKVNIEERYLIASSPTNTNLPSEQHKKLFGFYTKEEFEEEMKQPRISIF